ncbi:helix-turn-helix transcriptional regulator [Methylobacterium radiotolerans]|uniref:helix-turn-helix transcriptional regulator n=1 Tax=Methylobacterium radiotolerans TaxID=31998 RepID=UPI0038D0F9E0
MSESDYQGFPSDWPVDRGIDGPSFPEVRDAKLQMLAQCVRERRIELGWSQAELGRRAELNRNVINTLERRTSFPRRENVIRIAGALGVAVPHLTNAFVHEDMQRAPASLSMTQACGQPNVVLLQIHRRVSPATALKVMAVLSEDSTEAA